MKTRAKVGSSDWDAMAPAAIRSALIASTPSQRPDAVADALRFLRVNGALDGQDVRAHL